MKVLAILYMFSVGFIPMDEVGIGNRTENVENATSVEFMLGVDLFDCLTIYGGERTKQTMREVVSWSPYNQLYYIGASLHKELKGVKLELNLFRECSHPVDCWGRQNSNFNDAQFKIELKISGRIDIL